MRTRLGTAFLAALAALIGPADAKDAVSLRLEWRLTGYHLPFYWAKEKGFYAAENLEVDIKEGSGSGTTINLINAKQDDIGLADYMLLAAHVAKGMQVKGIYALVPNGAWAIVSPADKKIEKPTDMLGKTVAMTADHKGIFDLLLAANKIAPDQVSVQVTNAATRNTVFVQGQVDSFLSVVIGSPLDLVVRANQGKGKPIHFMPLENFGVAPMGQGLIVHQSTIETKGDLLKRFLRATTRGITETMKTENVEEAVGIAIKHSKASDERRESVKLQWAETWPRMRTKNTTGKPFGWIADADAQANIDVLTKAERLTKPLAIKDLFTNDFVAN
jgi:NitT/TauT family transport system substrate-binding protein